MKCFITLALLSLSAPSLWADFTIGRFDLEAIRDTSNLETRVIEDWHPMANDASLRQKLVEITVVEWWPGQKVRLPVSFVAPAQGVCTNVLIENMGLVTKSVTPTGSKWRLLKEHGVGLVFIGMVPITDMEPVGQLHRMMEDHFLKTRDTRYTPAWIWGISDMRALTAAMAESEVFQPKKVLATGGSKRGVATATAGIWDDRFTAIMPVVTPIIESPGGPYVEGTMSPEIVKMNDEFLAKMSEAGRAAMLVRQKARSDERITLAEAQANHWSEFEIKSAGNIAWEVCRTTNYLEALEKRGLEVFYNEGSNDNVGPGLVALGRRFPQLNIYVMPGGQHGGAKEAGFSKATASQPEVEENLRAFALHHFFGTRRMVASPGVSVVWNKGTHQLKVEAVFKDGSLPQENTLWWSVNRHPDYSMAMEFDEWRSVPMQPGSGSVFQGEAHLEGEVKTIDVITVHQHEEGGSTLTVSSHEVRIEG